VALRLGEYLSERPGFGGHVEVAIDGASVRVGEAEVFDIVGFLASAGWSRDSDGIGRNAWATLYRRAMLRSGFTPALGRETWRRP
jgi:hypothetical protein